MNGDPASTTLIGGWNALTLTDAEKTEILLQIAERLGLEIWRAPVQKSVSGETEIQVVPRNKPDYETR